MMPDERRVKERWKAALAATDECISLEELSRHAEGSLTGEDDRRVSSHLSICPRCQTELEMLQQFEQAAPHPEEAANVELITAELKRRFGASRPVAKESSSIRSAAPGTIGRLIRRKIFASRRVGNVAMALSAMLLLVVGGLYWRTAKEPLLVSDGSSGQTVFRSQAIVTLEPKGDLERSPAELRWQPVPGATRYSVRLMEVDRSVLWQSSSEQTKLVLPREVREKIIPGKTLLWEVTAIGAGGNAVAASPVERFRVPIKPGH